VVEESLPIQTVGHIVRYCPGQRDSITASHHATWKTLQGGIAEADPKGWNFPSVQGELTIGQLWADNKMDEICTIDALWTEAQDSEMKRPLSQENEEICKASLNPGKTRQKKAKERFLRTRPDGIAHHTKKKSGTSSNSKGPRMSNQTTWKEKTTWTSSNTQISWT